VLEEFPGFRSDCYRHFLGIVKLGPVPRIAKSANLRSEFLDTVAHPEMLSPETGKPATKPTNFFSVNLKRFHIQKPSSSHSRKFSRPLARKPTGRREAAAMYSTLETSSPVLRSDEFSFF
jgi:hypothetical protein